MPYRRYPLIHRKYSYPYSKYPMKELESDTEKAILKDSKLENSTSKRESIPLPNEPEHIPGPEILSETGSEMFTESRDNSIFSFLKLSIKKIQTEDIIIIALIFLLLNEEILDDILLIILIYILLT